MQGCVGFFMSDYTVDASTDLQTKCHLSVVANGTFGEAEYGEYMDLGHFGYLERIRNLCERMGFQVDPNSIKASPDSMVHSVVYELDVLNLVEKRDSNKFVIKATEVINGKVSPLDPIDLVDRHMHGNTFTARVWNDFNLRINLPAGAMNVVYSDSTGELWYEIPGTE
jgi:hypothetical protein